MNPDTTPPIPRPVGAQDMEPNALPSDDARGWTNWLAPLALLLAMQVGAPSVPVPNEGAALVGVALLTPLYVAAVVAFSLALARRQLKMPVLLVGFAACGAAWALAHFVLRQMPRADVFQTFSLLGLGTFFGLVVSRLVKHANMVGPIGVLVALIDIWGVLFGGIVSQLLTNKATQHIARTALATGPKLGAPEAKFAVELPSIGIGDFLFLAFFLGLLVRFNMNWRASALWMWGLVALALLLIVLNVVPHLPGLLFLGAGAVLPNLRYFQFTREERFALLYAGIFVLLLTVGLYLGLKSMLPMN